MPKAEAPFRGVLRLDDGGCLHVDLMREFVQARGDWDGRRVAIRGVAVPVESSSGALAGSCNAALLLYADRLSLKADL